MGKMKKEEELEFQRKVELTIGKILSLILKVFLAGAIILILVAFITSNSSLVYPTSDKIGEMLIHIFILGSVFMVIYRLLEEHRLKKKK